MKKSGCVSQKFELNPKRRSVWGLVSNGFASVHVIINAFISGSTSSDQICSEHFRENTRWRAASGEVPIGLTNVTGTTACT